MKKTVRSIAAGVIALVVLAAGTGRGAIVIKGSNTFGEELGPALIEAYLEQHPDAEIEIESRGSATGFKALAEGTCTIAASSRVVSEDELRMLRAQGVRMKQYSVGYYGVAVIVHEANAIDALGLKQVERIFTGEIDSWSVLGGADQPIQRVIRDPISGTYLGFRELAMNDRPYAEDVQTRTNDLAIVSAVADDSEAIGYIGMELLPRDGVKALTINGMPPTDLAVNEGLYPYARLMRFYTNRATETREVRRFIRFVQSDKGEDIMRGMGYVPRDRKISGRSLSPVLW